MGASCSGSRSSPSRTPSDVAGYSHFCTLSAGGVDDDGAAVGFARGVGCGRLPGRRAADATAVGGGGATAALAAELAIAEAWAAAAGACPVSVGSGSGLGPADTMGGAAAAG